jgi:adenylyltransferase/sulfurtransferase
MRDSRVLDGTDNFPTRYLVNDACVFLGKPNAYGSIYRFEGQASVFHAAAGPCYRCLFREPPPPGLVPSCAEGGVLGVLPGIIGSIQALETLKLILGRGSTLIGRLILFDALKFTFRELTLRKDPECSVCGENPTVTELIDYEAFCSMGAARTYEGPEVTATDLAQEWEESRDLVVIDVREPHEWEICHLQGAMLIPAGARDSAGSGVPKGPKSQRGDRRLVYRCGLVGPAILRHTPRQGTITDLPCPVAPPTVVWSTVSASKSSVVRIATVTTSPLRSCN